MAEADHIGIIGAVVGRPCQMYVLVRHWHTLHNDIQLSIDDQECATIQTSPIFFKSFLKQTSADGVSVGEFTLDVLPLKFAEGSEEKMRFSVQEPEHSAVLKVAPPEKEPKKTKKTSLPFGLDFSNPAQLGVGYI